jgi:hypothetical protein
MWPGVAKFYKEVVNAGPNQGQGSDEEEALQGEKAEDRE